MVVLVQLAVKTFLPSTGLQFPDQAVCGKGVQIAIDSRQTDTGLCLPNAFVEFVRGGVRQVVPQSTQNTIPLMGHAQVSSHNHLSE